MAYSTLGPLNDNPYALTYLRAGIISPNEARQLMGYEPLTWHSKNWFPPKDIKDDFQTGVDAFLRGKYAFKSFLASI